MKTLSFFRSSSAGLVCAMLCAAPAVGSPATKAPTARDYYNAGIKAIQQGNEAKARKYFQAAQKLAPNDGNITYQLKNLHQHSAKMSQTARKKKLEAVVIPEVKLQAVTLDEALTALTAYVDDVSQKQVITNFVVQDPKKVFAAKKVSLSLTHVPATAVLDFILRSAGAKASYDQYAITITPAR